MTTTYYYDDQQPAEKENYKGFSENLNQGLIESVPDEVIGETQADTQIKTKYKAPKKENPVTSKLEFAPVARNLQIGSIYTMFICGFTSVVMTPSDPIWASYIPGGYCILLSFLLYVWCFFSEFNKQDKVTVEDILNPKQWPEHVCTLMSILNRNETQCAFCFFGCAYSFFCVQTAVAGFHLLFASFFFFVAAIRKEKPIKITGII